VSRARRCEELASSAAVSFTRSVKEEKTANPGTGTGRLACFIAQAAGC